MYPHERSLVKQLADKPFVLIGVNSDKDLDKIRETAKEKELTWRSFQNKPDGQERAIADDWAVRGWPTIVVLDVDQSIRYRGHDGDAATEVVKELLAKITKKQ